MNRISEYQIKIKKLESFTTKYVSAVRLTMEDGSQGWGQMSTYFATITSKIFHQQIAPHVIGKEFNNFTDLENLILEREHKFPGSYVLRALAGLDTALWDWLGRKEELPVTELIGGNIGKVPVYASSMKFSEVSADLHRIVTCHIEHQRRLCMDSPPSGRAAAAGRHSHAGR